MPVQQTLRQAEVIAGLQEMKALFEDGRSISGIGFAKVMEAAVDHIGAVREQTAVYGDQERNMMEIQRLKSQGRTAFIAGESDFGAGGWKPGDMTRAHYWLQGWHEAQRELCSEEETLA